MTMMHDEIDGDSGDSCNDSHTLKRKGDNKLEGKMKKSKHCRASKAKWSPEEDETLARAVMMSGEGNWKKIAQSLNDRSHLQCLHRWQKVLNPALVKGPWKEEEDAKLTELVEKYGPKDWSTIASHIPGRIGKQCRERWFNHLSPDVRKTNWSPDEDRIIIDAHSKIGNKWTNISKLLEGRPANAIKNHWNSTLLKRIQDSTGEPTPRRDRTRTKKPAPIRATEFDFRTQLRHSMEDTHCSPQYQLSPASSPEMPYQEPPRPMVNVRFQYPTETVPQHQIFYNPFNVNAVHELANHGNVHAPASYSSAAAVWDSWPATNVIHLNPAAPTLLSTPHSQAVSNSVANLAQLGSFLPVGFTHHNNINNMTSDDNNNTAANNNTNNIAINSDLSSSNNNNENTSNLPSNNDINSGDIQNNNSINNIHNNNNNGSINTAHNIITHTIPNNNAHPPSVNMYDVEYGLGLVSDPDLMMEMYNNCANQNSTQSSAQSNTQSNTQNNTSNNNNPAVLPVELQYCFDHHPQQAQQVGGVSMDPYAPLSLDSSGMNIHNMQSQLSHLNSLGMSANLNMGMSMGLLNLDMPSLYPLDL